MNLDLDALEATARAATPGPWEVDLNTPYSNEIVGIFAPGAKRYAMIAESRPVGSGPVNKRANAAHMATASPDVVLALIERLRAAEARVAPPADDVREAVEAERQRAAGHSREGYRANENCDDITKRILSGEPAVDEIPGRVWGATVDDVRERLARIVTNYFELEDQANRTADAILAAFEVRPRGTVTDTAHDRDHMMICRKCGAGLTALDVVYGEKPCPRATATDAAHNGEALTFEQYIEGTE